MPVIRINKQNYEALQAKSIEEDRPLIRVVTRILTDALQPKGNPKIKDKKTHPLFGTLKQIWLDTWKQNNKYDFLSWGAAHSVSLNAIIKKIEVQTEGENTEQVFQIIMDKLPQFYRDKFLTAINKNYDTIISDIKNGGNKGNKLQQDAGIYDWRK